MDILTEVYHKSATENERNLHFWENYLQNLKTLDFSVFSDKLKVPTLVPIGSRILFRGELKHTNEVTVALGADYFVKCSLKQAEVLRQHRIKDAQSKVDTLTKEKEYLENQMSFTKKAVYDNPGQEIIEYYSEDDDKVWREKHRENMRRYKQGKGKEDKIQTEDITDEELWDRLEELELQEEMENELSNMNGDNEISYENKENQEESFVVKEDMKIKNKEFEDEKKDQAKGDSHKIIKTKKVTFKESKKPVHTSKFDLLQQVIDKQNELEEKLFELKNKERNQSKNETDLMSRLDELEQLDELEDEMDRLDDIIENEDVDDEEEEEEEHSNETQIPKLQRRVSFVDEDDSETLEITFEHSSVNPKNEPYDPNKGIQKPSDIYEVHSKLFENGTTSILKKSKYEAPEIKTPTENVGKLDEKQDSVEPQTIVIKDVVENSNKKDPKSLSQARPTSLFKKKRMQNKS